MSAIETLACRREMSLIGSTSFGFAQNTIRDFHIELIVAMSNDKCHKNNGDRGIAVEFIIWDSKQKNAFKLVFVKKVNMHHVHFNTYIILGKRILKVALQIFGRTFYKNTKKSSLSPKAFYFSFIKPQYTKAIRQQEKLEIYYGAGRH